MISRERLRSLTDAARTLFATFARPVPDFTVLFPDNLTPPIDLTDGTTLKSDWLYEYCCAKNNRSEVNPDTDLRWTSFEIHEEVLTTAARVQLSRCFSNSAWSATFRWNPPHFLSTSPYGASKSNQGAQSSADIFFSDDCKWRPDPSYGFSKRNGTTVKPWLFSINEVAECIWDQLSKPYDGLILITGATDSAKSQVARGLVWRRLYDLCQTKPRRKPHLVTYEDPIEEYIFDKNLYLDREVHSGGSQINGDFFDYTPRSAHIDCHNLEEALTSALRQSPAVFYVGELRTEADIRLSIEFGGTGHLIVATAHAGNLIEAVRKILKAVGAEHPGTRAVFVPKILAIIHLATLSTSIETALEGQTAKLNISGLVPSIYRRSTLGMQNLIADGLVALMPTFPRPEEESMQHGSLGRQFFVRTLCGKRMSSEEQPQDEFSQQLFALWPRLRHWSGNYQNNDGLASGDRLIDVALLGDLRGH